MSRLRPFLHALLVVTLVGFAIDAALEQLSAAADLWWHLAIGRYIVEHLAIPRHDVFSYTYEGARCLNPEWLADVFLYLVAVAEMTGVDLADAVTHKMKINAARTYRPNHNGVPIRDKD